ncbi:MAG TPA: aquaporin [Candidatus Dormibacteraeota bacterium]|nr:aquaporin [Candidatus Dormibacteraeota bacterium]
MLRLARQLAAEFLGTFLVVLIAAGSSSVDPWLKAAGEPVLGTIGTALAYGLAVAVAIEVCAPISGAHLNPAISLGQWATRRINTWRLAGYTVAQLAGAVAAASLLETVIPDSAWQPAGLGTPVLASSLSRAQGMGLEAVLTFVVCLVFFRTAAVSGKPSGWAVGASVAAAVMVAGPFTGAALNPARAFGPAFVFSHWANHGVWWVGPLSGGVFAAWISSALGHSPEGV